MAAATARQLLVHRLTRSSSTATLPAPSFKAGRWSKAKSTLRRLRGLSASAVAARPPRAAAGKDAGIVPADGGGDDDGVSLGTVKLPANIDVALFEALLFQWANSLCQGANLPLPVPLKVDKVVGGVRLGFIGIEDGATQELVYIDCLVFPATSGSGPVFRAVRNGPLKGMEPPGEPRIMRSLLQALQKSIQIAQV